MSKRLPLAVRRSMNLTEPAYERLDDFADADKLAAVFEEFIDEYGAPAKGGTKK